MVVKEAVAPPPDAMQDFFELHDYGMKNIRCNCHILLHVANMFIRALLHFIETIAASENVFSWDCVCC